MLPLEDFEPELSLEFQTYATELADQCMAEKWTKNKKIKKLKRTGLLKCSKHL